MKIKMVGGLFEYRKTTFVWNFAGGLAEHGIVIGMITFVAGLMLGPFALVQDCLAEMRLEEVVVVATRDPAPAQEVPASVGTQYSWEQGQEVRVFLRAEIIGYGRYFYNAANTESQDAYWLTNLRTRVHAAHRFAEAWVKNAFDTKYVPVAFEYPNGRSGFLGENGAPLTAGLRIGYTF